MKEVTEQPFRPTVVVLYSYITGRIFNFGMDHPTIYTQTHTHTPTTLIPMTMTPYNTCG